MIGISKKTLVQIALGIVVLAGVAVGVFALNRSSADASVIATPPPARPPARVQASAPQRPTSTVAPPPAAAPAVALAPSPLVKVSGNLISADQASLAFQSSGRIENVKVQEGDQVKTGDVIATLDTAALDAEVVQAQAALDSANANLVKTKAGPTMDDVVIAKSNVDRAKAALAQAQAAYDKIGGAANPNIGLTQQSMNLQQAYSTLQAAISQYNLTVGHPTDAELKAAEAAVAQAQAALEIAKQNAANARITAPFDGTVLWVGAKLGESAVSGAPAITIADLPKMQVVVNADELSEASIQVGQSVSIIVDALPGKTLTGHVSKIGLLASTTGNIVSTPVTIDIDPSNAVIYPGLTATVQFQGAAQ